MSPGKTACERKLSASRLPISFSRVVSMIVELLDGRTAHLTPVCHIEDPAEPCAASRLFGELFETQVAVDASELVTEVMDVSCRREVLATKSSS